MVVFCCNCSAATGYSCFCCSNWRWARSGWTFGMSRWDTSEWFWLLFASILLTFCAEILIIITCIVILLICSIRVCTKQNHTKKANTEQSEKQSQLIIVLTIRQAENCPLFKKHNEQNSDRRSRANVLRACQQNVGLNTNFKAGYRREAATRAQRRRARSSPPATLKRTVLYWTVFFPPLHDFWDFFFVLDCFVWDCFVYAPFSYDLKVVRRSGITHINWTSLEGWNVFLPFLESVVISNFSYVMYTSKACVIVWTLFFQPKSQILLRRKYCCDKMCSF